MCVFLTKKVLLRERKRHTVRCIASARYADLSPQGGGAVPHPVLDGGVTPILVLVPPSCPTPDPGWGTLHQQDGGTPRPDLGRGTSHQQDRVPF